MGIEVKLTSSEVESLSPDASSLKAARGLVKQAKWPLLAYSEQALWGHCQGSGKNPYVAMVDLSQPEIAFKCSCPSRKFPCKHGLALLLNFVEHQDWFLSAAEPANVTEWLEKRAATAQKKEQRSQDKLDKAKAALEKAQQAAQEAAAGKAQVKSASLIKREAAIAEGVAELKLWLDDCLRSGLLQVMDQRFKDINRLSKRLIDAKAPALANMLQEAKDIDCSSMAGRRQYLKHLSRLYLLASTFEQRESLPREWQSEIARLVGITTPKEEVMAAAMVANGGQDVIPEQVLVVADVPDKVANGTTHRQFCYRLEQQAFVSYFTFVPNNTQAAQQVDQPLPVGAVFSAKVYPYPGLQQVPRVLLEERVLHSKISQSDAAAEAVAAATAGDHETQDAGAGAGNSTTTTTTAALRAVGTADDARTLWAQVKGVPDMLAAVKATAQYMAQNPFADFYPVVLELANFAQQGAKTTGTWYLGDSTGHARQLSGEKTILHQQVVSCLALTGGAEFTAVVLLNDVTTILCGLICNDRYVPLPLPFSFRLSRQ
ncbi:MAG: SWIM zinc finger family protein [Candidatus Anaerobiospirillum pullicola]|uniref:SWIM zinc finger family protein n=1 Tax=Candidatus Anaerobiospirillum pullicola TaxID=2838451 RepID=A0A948WY99_9GAMM|nr:SWIM zinc finger family protein [Candidatus Anaerobiospirillum pullicola]